MSEYENRNSGWAIFGKVSLGTLLLGALGTGIGFGVKGIYDTGYRDAERATVRQAKDEAKRNLDELTKRGLVLPEEGCWRYVVSENKFPLLTCTANTGTYTVHMTDQSTFKDLTYIRDNTKSVVTRSSAYGSRDLTLDTYITRIETK